MKPILYVALGLAVAAMCTPVVADPDRDESGHGRKSEGRSHKGGEYKEEFWDGDCKVERKWEKSGEYKEEVKCKEPRSRARHVPHEHRGGAPREAGVIVTPPSVVIQPPTVVIEPPLIKIK